MPRRRGGTSQSGEYYWNSGMFMFRAQRVSRRARAARAGDARGVRARVRRGAARSRFHAPAARRSSSACPSDSIDYAVMEKTRDARRRAARCRLERRRLVVGAARRAAARCARQRHRAATCSPRTRAAATCTRRAAWSRAVGLKDHVVVETKDAVLVAPRDRVQDVKQLVAQLKAQGRYETSLHREVFRPWGSYDSIDNGERFQVKRLVVKPGALDVAAAASPSRRALDRRLRHGAHHARRRDVPARRERVDLHSDRHEAPHRESGQDSAAHHRGAVRHAISARTTSCASRIATVATAK